VWEEATQKETSKTLESVSIILPFRNEKDVIVATIYQLLQQNYPGIFEIICVDDHSEDGSGESILSIEHDKMKLVASNGTGKKAALKTGIDAASFDWIMAIDADTLFGPGWLTVMMATATKKKIDMCIGPVKGERSSWFKSLVSLEFIALSGTGLATANAGIPILANGANLLFKKSKFYEVDGFSGNERISSGDDVFLLRKFQKLDFAIGVCLHYDAIGKTRMPANLKALLSQRIRWGSKNKAGGSVVSTGVLLIVLLANLALITGLVASFSGGVSISTLIYSWLLKLMVDFVFLLRVLSFTRQTSLLVWFPLLSLLFPVYLILTSLAGLFLPSKWKERPVSAKQNL
jgi:glycosyltransferase involved in cell wall biosynthesis